jgi:predicted ester cyclase
MPDVRRLLTDQIERLWGAGELEVVWRNYSPDVVDRMPVPGQLGGLPGMEQVVREFRAAMPDLRMTLHGTIVDGDPSCASRGCDWWTATGTNTGPLFGRPPTGRRVEIRGVDMIRAEGGRVAEIWHVEEMLRFDAQLAGEPEPAIDPLAAFHAASSDLRVTEEAVLQEGPFRAVRSRVEGTHDAAPLLGIPPAGRRFSAAHMAVLRTRPDGAPRLLTQVAELAQVRAQLA